MSDAFSIGSVMARIGAIESRFAPVDVSDPAPGPIPVLDDGPDFEAFGAAYQKALATRDAGATAMSSGLSMTGTGFPGLLQPAAGTMTTVPMNMPSMNTAPASMGSTSGVAAAAGSPLVTAAINGVAGPPGERKIGGYGTMPVPAEVQGFGNGKIPSGSLTPLTTQPNHKLYAPAAASWNNLVAAARADGIEMKITDSYRPYEEQVDLARRKGLYSQGGLAATPGKSNHGWGLAVDANVNDPKTLQWMKVNGPRFGWVEAVPREPWHWEFRPDQV